MKRIFLISNLIVAFLFIVVGSCSSTPATDSSKKPAAPESPPAQLYKVEIINMQFLPAIIKVKKGDKIVFVNRDMVEHDVTEQSKKLWSSSPIKTGEYWTLTVDGSADYYCSIHVVMKGKIVAE